MEHRFLRILHYNTHGIILMRFKQLFRKSFDRVRLNPDDIIGVGVDFTSCTVLPVKNDGTPLCFIPQYKNEPNAYVKLWKHHAAQGHANRLNKIAQERGAQWFGLYGGKISSEWLFPKIMQILEESPEIYAEMDFFIEAADWIVWQLTGRYTRNSCSAGYKAIWSKSKGISRKRFFNSIKSRTERCCIQ